MVILSSEIVYKRALTVYVSADMAATSCTVVSGASDRDFITIVPKLLYGMSNEDIFGKVDAGH